MKRILTILALVGLVSCKSSFKCDFQKVVVNQMADGLHLVLGCSEVDAIQKDLMKWSEPLGLCDKDLQRMKGSGICAALGDMVLSAVLKGGVPQAWKCTGGLAKDQAPAIFGAICSGL